MAQVLSVLHDDLYEQDDEVFHEIWVTKNYIQHVVNYYDPDEDITEEMVNRTAYVVDTMSKDIVKGVLEAWGIGIVSWEKLSYLPEAMQTSSFEQDERYGIDLVKHDKVDKSRTYLRKYVMQSNIVGEWFISRDNNVGLTVIDTVPTIDFLAGLICAAENCPVDPGALHVYTL